MLTASWSQINFYSNKRQESFGVKMYVSLAPLNGVKLQADYNFRRLNTYLMKAQALAPYNPASTLESEWTSGWPMLEWPFNQPLLAAAARAGTRTFELQALWHEPLAHSSSNDSFCWWLTRLMRLFLKNLRPFPDIWLKIKNPVVIN